MMLPIPGQILHVRGYSWVSRLLRWMQNVWLEDWLRANFNTPWAQEWMKKHNILDPDQLEEWIFSDEGGVWGSHDGIVIRHDASLYGLGVAEALAGSNRCTVTPWENYVAAIQRGECDVRLYDVPGMNHDYAEECREYYMLYYYGEKYDFAGIYWMAKAILKTSMTMWRASVRRTLRTNIFADLHSNQNDLKHWCTELVRDLLLHGANLKPFHSSHPIPMHVEMAAGELPYKFAPTLTLGE